MSLNLSLGRLLLSWRWCKSKQKRWYLWKRSRSLTMRSFLRCLVSMKTQIYQCTLINRLQDSSFQMSSIMKWKQNLKNHFEISKIHSKTFTSGSKGSNTTSWQCRMPLMEEIECKRLGLSWLVSWSLMRLLCKSWVRAKLLWKHCSKVREESRLRLLTWITQ